MKKAAAAAAAIGLASLTCHQAILVAPPGSTIALFANPQFIPANGGVSVISALVIEPAGTPVPDGTVVQFFTNLGRIDEQGKTNDGVARVNLVSDSRSGIATVVAFSGGPATAPAPAPSPGASPAPSGGTGVSNSVQVAIGSSSPARVQVVADFPRIEFPARHSDITAYVFDANGNLVSNVPVIFTVEAGPASSPGDPFTEFMESVGRPIFTDTNGAAKDVLVTRYPPTAPPKTVTVRATPAGRADISGTVLVRIN